MEIKLTKDQKKILNKPSDIYPIMREILMRDNKIDRNREHFWAVGLGQSLLLQYVELISLGGTKRTTVEPMNVFRLAVMKGSARIILVHNHPSESLEPSDPDKNVTDRLYQVGKILDVEVDDHLIITPKAFYSFAESGLLAELAKSTEYVPQYELEERYRREKEAIVKEMLELQEKMLKDALEEGRKVGLEQGEKTGEKNKAIEMARAALAEGLDVKLIMKLTGLTKKVIEGLRE
ncbi:JAB domain-containing protein [Breznakiella homolactica]|uniref:MPN domain-containing protein n=1 Tax=Breznakiella homolactica TaxID=2798577 RepID=A0A7T7XJZ8_9SPIR|nr:JAB domain-containing protein [Breznakiella homolactica]QQO07573.1 hypothetical protein JFL75_11510 [Breznakiella homolactica]